MRPVVITTCVQYADLLTVTLPYTVQFAKKVYVVTTPEDPVDVLHDSVEIVRTQAFKDRGASFNKAAALRETQQMVHARHPRDWIVLLDADIVASPEQFATMDAVQDGSGVYLARRIDYLTPEDFRERRGVTYGVVGAGYFQMYYDKTKLYPAYSEDASDCDMHFFALFGDRYSFVPGTVAHLGAHTVNWKGRASPEWV